LAAWRTRKPWLVAALAAGIVVQQFTVFTIPTALIFYAVIAFSVAPPPNRESARLAWPARLLLGVIAALILYVAFRFAAADRVLELANHQIAAGDAAGAQAYYQKYQDVRLPGASADLWYARSLFALSQKGDPPHRMQALWMAVSASRLAAAGAEEPSNARYNLAELSAAVNDAANTETSLRRAIAANPAWFKPHWTLAQLLRLEGRASQAADEAALAADLDGGKHPEVAQTLADIRALPR
jgi:hypothetical protein